ncbi:MAG: branched-chain amino acid ABC transporter ATP-binding protein/permease [Thermomicrobiales bacterium]
MLNDYHSDIAILILIYVALGASLNLLMGYAGQFSMAQAAFYGIGAYTAGILTANRGWNPVLSVIAAAATAAGFATIVSIPATKRVKGEYLILLTLAFQMVVHQLMNSMKGLTGGPYGLTVPWLHLLGRDFIAPSQFLPVMAVVTLFVLLVCWGLGQSPFGRLLKGIREDEPAVRALGKNTTVAKLLVFGITAALAGLVGGVSAFYYQFIAPGAYSLDLSIFIVSIVVLGGMGNLTGTIIAATILGGLRPLLQNLNLVSDENSYPWQAIIYGSAIVGLMLFRSKGVLPEGTGIGSLFRLGRRRAVPTGSPEQRLPPVAVGVGVGNGLNGSNGHHPGDAGAPQTPAAPSIVSILDAPVIVEMTDLAKRFGGIYAVDGVNIALREHRITALIGPNGAGKTTIFNLLTGVLTLDRGQVTFRGVDITGRSPDQIARLGIARSFQDVRLFRGLTVLQNVALAGPGQTGENIALLTVRPLRSRAVETVNIEQARHYLQVVGMTHKADERVASLGYGEQKLVAIARLLATECDVLLLDEPTSGIDPSAVQGMISLVLRLRDLGRTVCIVEHSLSVVEQLADHVVFMEEGRVTAEGAIADLKRQPRLVEVYFGT